jgi:hypothetical protein
MSNRIVPARFRNEPMPAPEPQPQAPVHQSVENFLNHHANLTQHNRELIAALDESTIERKAQHHRIVMLEAEIEKQRAFYEGENTRLRIERDQYARACYELKAQMSVGASAAIAAANTASAAAKSVADVHIAALEAVNEQFIRAGIHEPERAAGADDDRAAEIGRKFGAGELPADAAE